MKWDFDAATGCLRVSGQGRLRDFGEKEERPWEAYREKIKHLIVESGVTGIGDCAFLNCTALEQIELPETLELVGVYSFCRCTALTRVQLPHGLRIICAKAFRECTSLEEVYLPDTVTHIDMRAFSKDEALRKVVYEGTPGQWKQILISMAASDNRYLLEADLQCLRDEENAEQTEEGSRLLLAQERYEEMVSRIRQVLAQGGDGSLYFVTPRLVEPGVRAKCGDCTLVVFPNGQTMMIDAGFVDCSKHIIALLEKLELTQLDYFVLSHAHDDHAGGVLAVAQYLYGKGGGIKAYYRSAYIAASRRAAEYEPYLLEKGCEMYTDVQKGWQWNIGEVQVEVYHPLPEHLAECDGTDRGVNNVSLLMKFTYKASTYLTGGDLYRELEEELAEQLGEELQAEVMKSNHHGTYTSNGEKWLRTVAPKVIITDGDDIGNALLADYAAGQGIEYYSAGLDGLVLVQMNGKEYQVTVQRACK